MNYEITEEQIKELAKGSAKVKKMFPEVFETKLEIGKWYKDKDTRYKGLICVQEITEHCGLTAYGFGWKDGKFLEIQDGFCINSKNDLIEATDSEVEQALTNEAIKRGLVCGKHYTSPNNKWKRIIKYPLSLNENNVLVDSYSNYIMFKGKWATPIKTYTKEEAEKLLNAKIV